VSSCWRASDGGSPTWIANKGFNILIKENTYGHKARLDWIEKHLSKQDKILELGCGTGYMITMQLLIASYNVIGIDQDESSIEFGKDLLKKYNLPNTILKAIDVVYLEEKFDKIIASEVLEHLPDQELYNMICKLKDKLKDDGLLMITVPNGYGWFELESFLWFKLRLGKAIEKLRISGLIVKVKHKLIGDYQDAAHISTLSASPHIQRFTYTSIRHKLNQHNLIVTEHLGTVMFAGPFSNLLLTGFPRLMRLNIWLGRCCPRLSSGFMIACTSQK